MKVKFEKLKFGRRKNGCRSAEIYLKNAEVEMELKLKATVEKSKNI